ncbi:MAG: hypothetical protein ACWGO1_09100 [Anaerolineales bacterium]
MNETNPEANREQATQRAQAVKQAYSDQLMAKANVVGVGVGFCKRQGQRTDDVGLVVMVSRKLPSTQLQPGDIIPSEIEGVPVDVQEVGEIRAH